MKTICEHENMRLDKEHLELLKKDYFDNLQRQRNVNDQAWEKIKILEAERDRYKAALEEIAMTNAEKPQWAKVIAQGALSPEETTK